MTAPLFELSERVCDQIAAHQGPSEAEAFASTLLAYRAEAFAELPGGASGEQARALAGRVAQKQLELLAELPPMIQWIASEDVNLSKYRA